jgi:uncharacterized protein involved in exopolysaccharide biosynthesis
MKVYSGRIHCEDPHPFMTQPPVEGLPRPAALSSHGEQPIEPASREQAIQIVPGMFYPTHGWSPPGGSTSEAPLFLSHLLQQRSTLFWLALIGAIMGFLASFASPRIWRATTTILPIDNTGGKSSAEIMSILLKSRHMRERIAGRFAELMPLLFPQAINGALDGEPVTAEDLALALERKIIVYGWSPLEPLRLQVELPDRGLSQRVAEAYLDVLTEMIASFSPSSAGQNRHYLQQVTGTLRSEVEKAEEEFREFHVRNHLAIIDEQIDTSNRLLNSLSRDLLARRVELERQGSEDGFAAANGLETQANLDSLVGQIRLLEAGAQRLAKAREVEAAARAAERGSRADQTQTGLGAEFSRLDSRVAIARRLFLLGMEYLLISQIRENSETLRFTVIDRPYAARNPVRPYRPLWLVFGAVAGLLCALARVWWLAIGSVAPTLAPGRSPSMKDSGKDGAGSATLPMAPRQE